MRASAHDNGLQERNDGAMVTDSPMPRPLAGGVAVVAGGARGIGRAAAVALSGAGVDVAGIDIAAAVSPILDHEPATVDDRCQTRRLVTSSAGRSILHVADQRNIAAQAWRWC